MMTDEERESEARHRAMLAETLNAGLLSDNKEQVIEALARLAAAHDLVHDMVNHHMQAIEQAQQGDSVDFLRLGGMSAAVGLFEEIHTAVVHLELTAKDHLRELNGEFPEVTDEDIRSVLDAAEAALQLGIGDTVVHAGTWNPESDEKAVDEVEHGVITEVGETGRGQTALVEWEHSGRRWHPVTNLRRV